MGSGLGFWELELGLGSRVRVRSQVGSQDWVLGRDLRSGVGDASWIECRDRAIGSGIEAVS